MNSSMIIVPAVAAVNPRISKRAALVFGLFYSNISSKDDVIPLNRYLAKIFKVSKRTIQRDLEQLSHEGLIKLNVSKNIYGVSVRKITKLDGRFLYIYLGELYYRHLTVLIGIGLLNYILLENIH